MEFRVCTSDMVLSKIKIQKKITFSCERVIVLFPILSIDDPYPDNPPNTELFSCGEYREKKGTAY